MKITFPIMAGVVVVGGVIMAIADAASAGEVYVRNTDIYFNNSGSSRINVRGNESYNGIRREFSGAIKLEEFDRNTNPGRGQGLGRNNTVDIDEGFAGGLSVLTDVNRYRGNSSYQGYTNSSFREHGYTHELSTGTR